MADAYGTITFSKSTDCIFDAQELMAVLNTFEWDSSGGTWDCYENELLVRDGDGFDLAQSPLAIPIQVNFYTVSTQDEEEVQKALSEMTPDDWENIIEEDLEPMPLSALSEAISPLIDNGWIEIACVANQQANYIYFESLRVCADGKVLYRLLRSGPLTGTSDYCEEHSPISTEG